MSNLLVFAPGWTGLPKASYNPLLNTLAGRGHNTLSLEYEMGGIGSIGRTAHICEKELIVRRDDYEFITVIGHSMGGIVNRMFDPSLYDAYVSIASPHVGTWKAWAGALISKSARQMLPNSDFLRYCPVPTSPALAISASMDFTVPNAKLEGVENVTIPRTNHITVLWNRKTADTIDAWLPKVTSHRGTQSRVEID